MIFSIAGAVLSDAERDFFRETNPFGFIVFGRNCESVGQLRTLTDDLKNAVERDCPVLVDQEGGRVQRLKPPVWPAYPPMKSFGRDETVAHLKSTITQMAADLQNVGITVNCAPVLDVLSAGAHDVIGDRAFSDDPESVGWLGLAVCEALLAGGITPVIKHIPGHGRAESDSHKELPHVRARLSTLDEIDFKPFRTVSQSPIGRAIWGMMAHVVYEDLDPDHPASVSPKIIRDIVRERIGFEGLLLSDDLDMQALAHYGDVAQRGVETLAAGCDIALYCAGQLGDMQKIAKSVPKMREDTLKRL